MKKSIHPEIYVVKINCSCGKEFEIKSTRDQNLRIEVCSACHPFFTGKHRIVDTGGRVEKFNKKFENIFKFS